MMACPQSKPTTRTHQANVDKWNELCFLPIDDSAFSQLTVSTQNSANCENLCAAFQKTDHSLPIALNTDPIIAAVQKSCIHPIFQTIHMLSLTCDSLPPCPVDGSFWKDDNLLGSLHQIQTGTSPGPYTDSIDLLQTFALTAQHFSDPDKETVYPNLAPCCSLLDVLDAAQVPDGIIQYFSSSYFVALHKDVEDDSKLWSIGIGTHLHCVLGTLETYHHLAEFAELSGLINLPSAFQVEYSSSCTASKP
jgi:hypothetical protein